MYNKSPEESKKISWLSIFSSLCSMEINLPIDDIVSKAYELNDKLQEKYPLPDPIEVITATPPTPIRALGNCPDCGAPRIMSKAGKPYCSAKCWLKK